MPDISLHQALTLYLIVAVSLFVTFLALIARFYERLSGQRTYYRWLAVPVLLFAGAGLRFTHLDRLTGDWSGDLLLCLSGASLAVLCWHVYHLMTSGR